MSKKQVILFVIAGVLCFCAAIGCVSALVLVGRASDDATRAFGLVVMFLVFCLCLGAGGTLWYAGEKRWSSRSEMLIDKEVFTIDDKEQLLSDEEASAPAIPVTAVTLTDADVTVSPPEQTNPVTAGTLSGAEQSSASDDEMRARMHRLMQ